MLLKASVTKLRNGFESPARGFSRLQHYSDEPDVDVDCAAQQYSGGRCSGAALSHFSTIVNKRLGGDERGFCGLEVVSLGLPGLGGCSQR